MANKIVIKQGEAKVLTFTVTDGNGAAVNLSAAALLLGIKKAKSDAVYAFSKVDGDFDKSNAASGIVLVNLTATDTNQPEGTYVGELRCSWAGPVIEKSADFYLGIKKAVTT
jgi:hypothetical protein